MHHSPFTDKNTDTRESSTISRQSGGVSHFRSRPPYRALTRDIPAHWGGEGQPIDRLRYLSLTAATVFDVGCVPSPCSLDASVAGFSKLAL